jgi:transcriptional regulator with XRE-family HTH domain
MPHAKLLPDALRAAMERRGMTVQVLARIVGLNRADIAAMLDATSGGGAIYSLVYRRRIAHTLGVPVEQLWEAPRAKAPVTVEVDTTERTWVPPARRRTAAPR